MNLTRAQLIATLAAAGVPVARANWLAPDELGGNVFGTVSREWSRAVFASFMDEMKTNTPELVEIRPSPTGGVGRLVPKYFLNGFCCRGRVLAAYAHGMRGFAIQAAQSPTPLDHDALAWGFLHYTAKPRPSNLGRNGFHEILWGIDHGGAFFTMQDDGDDSDNLIVDELNSITLIFGQ